MFETAGQQVGWHWPSKSTQWQACMQGGLFEDSPGVGTTLQNLSWLGLEVKPLRGRVARCSEEKTET